MDLCVCGCTFVSACGPCAIHDCPIKKSTIVSCFTVGRQNRSYSALSFAKIAYFGEKYLRGLLCERAVEEEIRFLSRWLVSYFDRRENCDNDLTLNRLGTFVCLFSNSRRVTYLFSETNPMP